MKGIPIGRLKPAITVRLGRKALVLGGVAAIVGMSLMSGGIAKADIGGASGLVLSPTSGNGSVVPTYNSPACPAGFNGSAKISAVADDGTEFQVASANNAVAAPFSGTFTSAANMGNVFFNAYTAIGSTPTIPAVEELVVDCFASPSLVGAVNHAFDGWVTWTASDGSSWTFSPTKPVSTVPTTTTTLTANPNPAQTGQTVTLSATVTASSGTPAGTVSFENNGTIIGSPMTLDASGHASTTTTFGTAGSPSLTAVFNPTNSALFQGSTSTPVTEQVVTAGGIAITEPLQVTVAPSGTFTFTLVNTANPTVVLTPGTTNPLVATGSANQVAVNDTRNSFPGWSVTGQASAFTAPAAGGLPAGNIPATQLGWSPTGTVAGGAVLGSAVTAGSPGLGSAATLASAALGSGSGTSTLGANLTLNIPATAPVGTYSSTLTLTAVGVHP